MLIDSTYFIAEIAIPNLNSAGPAGQAVAGTLDWFISKYEWEFLEKTLGYELAAAFSTGWAELPTAQRWVDLVDGVAYEHCGKMRFWPGLRRYDTSESPVAMYVYFWFMRNASTQTTSQGEVKTAVENSEPAPAWKQVKAWNDMAAWCEDLHIFLQSNKAVYPEYAGKCAAFKPSANEFSL